MPRKSRSSPPSALALINGVYCQSRHSSSHNSPDISTAMSRVLCLPFVHPVNDSLFPDNLR